jgi:hypothetical protein
MEKCSFVKKREGRICQRRLWGKEKQKQRWKGPQSLCSEQLEAWASEVEKTGKE